MDLGKPNADDMNLAKDNQDLANSNSPTPAPSGGSDSQIPINSTPPSAPADENKSEMGVGKPDIGVELEEPKPPEPNPPVPPPASPAPSTPPPPATPEPPAPDTQPADSGIDVPINKYSNNVAVENTPLTPAPPKPAPPVAAIPQAVPQYNMPQPSAPIKAAPKNATAIVAVLAFLALILGTTGGFFGFRYLDKIKSSASEIGPTPTSSSSASTTTGKYASTKYGFSFEYPKDWFINTTSPQAESIIVASDEESLEGTASGYKVSIDFQSNDGKTLKAWVDSFSTTSGETRAAQEITVSGGTAYQQELTKNGPAIATYIPLSDTVMIVTYTAPADKYTTGQSFYTQIVGSFKVTE